MLCICWSDNKLYMIHGTYITILVTVKQCQLYHRIFLLEQQRTVNNHYNKRDKWNAKYNYLYALSSFHSVSITKETQIRTYQF